MALSLGACGMSTVTISSNPATDKSAGTPRAKVVFLAGADSHGPLAHEHEAGSKLLAKALREQQPGFETVNV